MKSHLGSVSQDNSVCLDVETGPPCTLCADGAAAGSTDFRHMPRDVYLYGSYKSIT